MSRPFIILDKITTRLRDKWFLGGTSWCINQGEHWAVIGPNGAGKSTLVKAIAGRVPVVKGTIVRCFKRQRALGFSIGYVSGEQRRDIVKRERETDISRHFSGRSDRTTTAQFLFDNGNQKQDKQGGNRQNPDCNLCFSGVETLLGKPVVSLSTGELSKVLVARAMIHRPELMIFDEPFDGLDMSASKELEDLMQKMIGEGVQVILVTHRKEEIPSFVTHILVLEDGGIVAGGKKEDFVSAMPSQYIGNPKKTIITKNEGQDPFASTKPGGDGGKDQKTLIKMNNVVVRYGKTIVLDRFSWHVRDGENWALKGPNGAGKSTVLRLITADMLQAYANEIYLFGKKRGTGESIWDIKKRIGVVSHEFHSGYLKTITAFDVVCSGFFDSVGLYRHCTGHQIKTAQNLMNALDIDMLSKDLFDRLSYGRRQMVLMARAMVKSPQLLILDEPCAGLDNTNRRKILSMIDHIGSRTPTNIIFVSHHEKEIPECITNELYLSGGKMIGTTKRDHVLLYRRSM